MFMVYNLISLITGISSSVSLIGMGFFDLDQYHAVHIGFTSLLLGSSNIYMVFSTLCTSKATSKNINCLNNVKGIIIVRWLLLSVIIVLNCAVSAVWMHAIELSKKHKANVANDNNDIYNKNNEDNDEEMRNIKFLLTCSAIGEYVYFIGFIAFVLLLIPTDLL
eukprot:UN07287